MPPIVFSALIVPLTLLAMHHAATCKRGGDAVLRHNKLRDILVVRPTFMFKLSLVLVLATIIPILGLQTSSACMCVCVRCVCVRVCMRARASLL